MRQRRDSMRRRKDAIKGALMVPASTFGNDVMRRKEEEWMVNNSAKVKHHINPCITNRLTNYLKSSNRIGLTRVMELP
jgi:hypothetical protein